MALTELGARPATYSRIITTVVPPALFTAFLIRLLATTRSPLSVATSTIGSCRGVRAIRATPSAHLGAPFAGRNMPRCIVAGVEGEGGAMPLEIELQGRD